MSGPRSVLARIVRNLDLQLVVLVGFATAKVYYLWKIERLQSVAVPVSEMQAWAGVDHRHGFYFSVPPAYRVLRPDSMTAPQLSRLFLSENGAILPQRHAPHMEINALGDGRYSHWGDYVVFSASDNSDPRSNGRTYTIRPEQGRANYVHFASAALSIVAFGCCVVVAAGMLSRRRLWKTADHLRPRLIHALASLTVSALALCILTSDWAMLTCGRQIAAGEPRRDGDRTFVAEIRPAPARGGRLPELFLVEARRSPFSEAVDAALGDSYAYGWFKALYQGHFPLATSDGWRRLTPIRAASQDVRHGFRSSPPWPRPGSLSSQQSFISSRGTWARKSLAAGLRVPASKTSRRGWRSRPFLSSFLPAALKS